jgi:hypothetical protein
MTCSLIFLFFHNYRLYSLAVPRRTQSLFAHTLSGLLFRSCVMLVVMSISKHLFLLLPFMYM